MPEIMEIGLGILM